MKQKYAKILGKRSLVFFTPEEFGARRLYTGVFKNTSLHPMSDTGLPWLVRVKDLEGIVVNCWGVRFPVLERYYRCHMNFRPYDPRPGERSMVIDLRKIDLVCPCCSRPL